LGAKVLTVALSNDQSGETNSVSATFSYDQDMTPNLSSVDRTLLTPYQLITLIFQVENMQGAVVEDISVKIGNEAYGFTDCTIVSLENNVLELL